MLKDKPECTAFILQVDNVAVTAILPDRRCAFPFSPVNSLAGSQDNGTSASIHSIGPQVCEVCASFSY